MNEEHAGEVQASWSAGRKASLIVGLLAALAIAGLILKVLPEREPRYNGKSLSYWLIRCEDAGDLSLAAHDARDIECREAVRHIGTNAVPILLRMLRARDSALKMKLIELIERWDLESHRAFRWQTSPSQRYQARLGFLCLGDLATNSIPALVAIYNDPSLLNCKEAADSVLTMMYPAPGAASPYWVPPPKRVEWFIDAGRVKSSMGQRSNAILAFSEVIKLDPTNAAAYNERAVEKCNLKDFAGALSDVKVSIQLDSSERGVFRTKGSCEFALKDFKSADADFTKAISADTNDCYAYNGRALARVNLRDLDGALADLNAAVTGAPGEAAFGRNRGAVEALQREYEAALADLSHAIALNDKDPIAYVLRGRVKSTLKDYHSALADFDKAIELNPKDFDAYAGRGATRMYMDEFESASADLEQALKLNPKAASAYGPRGVLKAKRGDGDGALADLKQALELGAQSPEGHALLGVFQYYYSKWGPALENCRTALERHAWRAAGDARFYIWLIRAQTGQEAEANQELKDYLLSLKGAATNEWEPCIARFLSGDLSETNFLGLATTTAQRPSAVRGQVCESLYYAGMKRKLAGDKAGAAERFQKCVDMQDDNNFGYLNARLELRSLTNNPSGAR